MCTMNFKPLHFISLFLLAGCGQIFHIDLPDNSLSFPADGGSIEYVSGFDLDVILVNGERQQTSPLYVDSTYVGESSEWISFIEGWRVGKTGRCIIEVKANPDTQPRSAELKVSSCNHYGEIFIYQEGRSD